MSGKKVETTRLRAGLKKMSAINVLVLAPQYRTAIRDEVNAVARYVAEVNVAVHYNPLVEISKYLPFGGYFDHVRLFTKDMLVNLENPRNVNVHLLPLLYFIPDGRNRCLGDKIFRKIDVLIQREGIDFDLIHGHFAWHYGYAGAKLKQKYKKPLIVSARGSDVRIPVAGYIKTHGSSFLKEQLNLVVDNADAIITYHEELQDLLLSEYKQRIESKLYLVHKGIDLKRFNPGSGELLKKAEILRAHLNIHNKFVILFLAGLNQYKDPQTFAQAAETLKACKDTVFVMVGGGQLKKSVEDFKNQKRIEDLIIVGPRRDTEVWYALTDVFCALSPVDNIWSTTLQEAFCMGKPSIVTEAGYSGKILSHLKDAYLIPTRDPSSLAQAVSKLRSDSELRATLSRGALSWRRRFDVERSAPNIAEIYNRVLTNFPPNVGDKNFYRLAGSNGLGTEK